MKNQPPKQTSKAEPTPEASGACRGQEMSPGCGLMRAVYISCHMMMRVIDRVVQPQGLTGSRWHLLVVVRNSETPLTITQLSERLFLSPQNVSRMITSLETEGLVTRDTSGPGRTVRVRLTEVGIARVDACALLADECADRMLDGIDPEDIRRTTVTLERMMHNTTALERALDQNPTNIQTPQSAARPAAQTPLQPETHE